MNEVAYIRFASVYRQFQGIRDFVETLNHLQNHSEDSPNAMVTAEDPSVLAFEFKI